MCNAVVRLTISSVIAWSYEHNTYVRIILLIWQTNIDLFMFTTSQCVTLLSTWPFDIVFSFENRCICRVVLTCFWAKAVMRLRTNETILSDIKHWTKEFSGEWSSHIVLGVFHKASYSNKIEYSVMCPMKLAPDTCSSVALAGLILYS